MSLHFSPQTRRVFHLSLPIFAELLLQLLVGNMDQFMISRFGSAAVIGLCLSKKGSRFTVGRFSMTFNAFLYALCLILFTPETAIYSVIYNFASAMVVDKAHQQNISVQALIFTRAGERELGRVIMDELGRGVTWWEGVGAYTGENVHVLCVCLSKYEIEELFHTVHEMDPHAFITLQEGVRIYGNFQKKLE